MSLSRTVIAAIAECSPLVATALGSPVAGFVVKGLCHLFGLDSIEQLPNILLNDKTAGLKIQDFATQYEDVLRHYQTEVDDRKDAREMERDLIDKGKVDWMIPFLVLLLFGSLVTIIWFMTQATTITSELSLIFGILVREIPAVYSYKFGDTGSIYDQNAKGKASRP